MSQIVPYASCLLYVVSGSGLWNNTDKDGTQHHKKKMRKASVFEEIKRFYGCKWLIAKGLDHD